MQKDENAVEMRFLVPPHLIDAARQAMSSFTIKEIPCTQTCCAPERKPDPSKLTNQELDLLLSE